MNCRWWRSRCAVAVAAVSLGTAVERGGTMMRRLGMTPSDGPETPSWS
jgi:hypothetical protein